MDVLQISPGKTVFRYLADAAILGVAVTEQLQKNSADLTFSFSAVSLDDHHPLAFVAGNQAVADKFLKCLDVLWVQEIIQKMQPALRLGCIRVITDWEPAPDDLVFFFQKGSVQEQGSVCQMNPIVLWGKITGKCYDFHQFHQVEYLLGYIGVRKGSDCVMNALF